MKEQISDLLIPFDYSVPEEKEILIQRRNSIEQNLLRFNLL